MYLLRAFIYLVILFSVGGIFLTPSQLSADPKNLVFSQITGSVVQRSGADLLKVIYRRLGIDVSFMLAPARRALDLSNKGKTDGEVFRIYSAGNVYKNLIRVPTPIISLSSYVFTLNKEYIVNSTEELKSVPRVGIVRGIIWAEKLVKGRRGVVYADNAVELASKLLKGSIDVALANRKTMQSEFKKRNMVDKLYKGNPIKIVYVYHYLHKSHVDLVDDVDEEIKKMIINNEIEQIIGLPYITLK